MKNLLLFCALILLTLFACSKDEDPIPSSNCLTSDMSFQNDVSPILSTNCFGCHSSSAAFGNIILDNYDEVKKVITAGRFLGAIKHDAGFSQMPQNSAKLSDCNIDKIAAWIEQGALNN